MLPAAVILLLAGCAAQGVSGSSAPSAPPPESAAPGTIVTLEFANATSRASMQVDLSSTDLQLEMRARPREDSSIRVASRPGSAAALPGTFSGIPPEATSARSARSVPLSETDSVTEAVVSGIRRSQDLFVRGRYSEALAAVESTIALRPTATAQALAGSALWSMGDRDGARRRWQAALVLDPSCPGVSEAIDRSYAPEAGKGQSR